MNVRDADSTLENAVELCLVEKLWVLRAYRFKFNRDFLIGADVGAMIDVTEGATA